MFPRNDPIAWGGGYVTKDSGERENFASGARRDTQGSKPRPDLISAKATLRHAELMARGAVKYGDRNWEKGMPTSRFMASLERHLLMYKLGDRTEDHLAAIRFNVDGVMQFEGTEWDDITAPDGTCCGDSDCPGGTSCECDESCAASESRPIVQPWMGGDIVPAAPKKPAKGKPKPPPGKKGKNPFAPKK